MNQAYTSLLSLYKRLMFPPPSYVGSQPIGRTGWTMTQIDEMDIHGFYEVMEIEITDEPPQEQEVYLSELW